MNKEQIILKPEKINQFIDNLGDNIAFELSPDLVKFLDATKKEAYLYGWRGKINYSPANIKPEKIIFIA